MAVLAFWDAMSKAIDVGTVNPWLVSTNVGNQLHLFLCRLLLYPKPTVRGVDTCYSMGV